VTIGDYVTLGCFAVLGCLVWWARRRGISRREEWKIDVSAKAYARGQADLKAELASLAAASVAVSVPVHVGDNLGVGSGSRGGLVRLEPLRGQRGVADNRGMGELLDSAGPVPATGDVDVRRGSVGAVRIVRHRAAAIGSASDVNGVHDVHGG